MTSVIRYSVSALQKLKAHKMIEVLYAIKTTLQSLSAFEISLISLNSLFIIAVIFLLHLSTNAVKQSLIIRNLFINFSDRCAKIIGDIKPNINYSLSNYEEDMQLELKKLYGNLQTDLNQLADAAKKEFEKEIISFQSKLRAKGLDELNKQDIINERVSIK